MIEAVVFDIDQTLWDFHASRRRALLACLELIGTRTTVEVTRSWTIDDLQARFDRLEATTATTRLSEIRRQSLAEAASEAAPSDADLAIDLHDLYFSHRHAPAEPFVDVVPALRALREAGVTMGIVSNGNSNLDRLGLDGFFDDVVLGPRHGMAKPDPAIYELVETRLGCRPGGLVCVGDDLHKDVVAPMQRGWRGVWNRRDDTPLPNGVAPDAVIEDLRDLRQIIERW